ncbi:MAG: CBS domain-containing protein [Bacillota bacterium]
MKVRNLLAKKGAHVETIGPETTVFEALCVLKLKHIGSLMVLSGEKVLGIVTERDILNECFERSDALRQRKVKDIMTKDIIIGVPDDTLDYVMGIMTQNRIRHLPIIDDGHLTGLISIGDVVKYLLDEKEMENKYMRDYISGEYPK